VGDHGFQFSTIVPVEPLKMVIELFAALPDLAGLGLSPHPLVKSATAATAATMGTKRRPGRRAVRCISGPLLGSPRWRGDAAARHY
jgi:hypothetical protein